MCKSDYRGAIVQFQRAIKDFPTFYEAYAQMGNAYLQLKEMAPAEEAMRKSVDLSSGRYSEAIFMLTGLLNDTNRFEDAATFARKGMDVDAGSWRGPFELARALSGLKQLDEAEKSAIEARNLKPDNPSIYLMLANIHIQRRDYAALQTDLEALPQTRSFRARGRPGAQDARRTASPRRQQSETQARADAEQKPTAERAICASRECATSRAHQETPPPPEPDSSGLPSLPPPVQNP